MHYGFAVSVSAMFLDVELSYAQSSYVILLYRQIGTDIEDFKCSWLVVKALERCSEEQKNILFVRHISCFFTLFFHIKCRLSSQSCLLLQEHYGKADAADVAKVKALYNDLDLQVCSSIFMMSG
jgi:hypothetical protein